MKTHIALPLLFAIALLSLGAGCSTTQYSKTVTNASGITTKIDFHRSAFMGDSKAQKLDLENATLEGYASEQSAIAATTVKAAIEAGLKAGGK